MDQDAMVDAGARLLLRLQRLDKLIDEDASYAMLDVMAYRTQDGVSRYFSEVDFDYHDAHELGVAIAHATLLLHDDGLERLVATMSKIRESLTKALSITEGILEDAAPDDDRYTTGDAASVTHVSREGEVYNQTPSGRWYTRGQTRTCQQCGREFGVVRIDAKFCSNACRQRAYRDRGGE